VPKAEPAIDLATLGPEAESWCETTDITPGDPAARTALTGGWSAPSHAVEGYLWGAGGGSELTFRRVDGRPFRIRMRGWAHPRLPEGQDVDLSLNGVALGRIRLGAAPQNIDVEVPPDRARPGLNRLVFDYPVVVPTGKYGRLLGPAWSGFRFVGGRATGSPSPPRTGEAIELPGGCGIDLFVTAAGGARLVLSGVEELGGAQLATDIECEGEPATFGAPGNWRRERPMRAAEGPLAPCRVTLRSVPAASSASAGEVTVGTAGLIRGATVATDEVRPAVPVGGKDPWAARPSFVLYLVDALRADQLGPYGGPSGLTPNVERFSTEAVLFERARAQSSWTRPAVASVFTGLTPIRHGATDVDRRLPEEVSTLAELLRQGGYRTGYVTANGNTTAAFGFDQGFDFFRWLHGESEMQKARWPEIHAAAREFFDGTPPAKPYFLVLHTVETHAPYLPSPVHRARWAQDADARLGERPTLVGLPGRGPGEEIERQVRQLYAAEVADADEGFGEILAELERRGRRAETSVLFLSDHGEELFDHGGVEHGKTLYEEQLEIPLIWSLPGIPGGRRLSAPIDQIDLAPTLLQLAGLAIPPAMQGRSFAAALQGGEPPAEVSSPAWLDRLNFHLEAIAVDGFKLIRELAPRAVSPVAGESLFDLAADPREGRPLGEARRLRQDWMRAKLRGWRARSGGALDSAPAVIDDQLQRDLRALGYLQ
jgi:arylsulfatase A-like enzyme